MFDEKMNHSLIQKASLGDQKALGKLMLEHAPALWPMCHRACAGKYADAEDVLQEIFYRACKGWKSFDTTRSVGAWLRGIGRKVIADRFRNQQSNERQMQVMKVNYVDSNVATLNSIEDVNNNKALKDVLEELDPLTRTVLVFRYIENLSWSEIAKECDISLEVVKKRLQRGKAKLRHLLNTEEGTK